MPKFVPRERKHRRLAKQKSHSKHGAAAEQDETNAVSIIPETQTEREARREKLAAEVHQQQPQDSKISGKKKKRLEKYIDLKLKKEENLNLLKKLASQKVDTTLFRSSKKLGRVTESKRERLSRALQERNAGLDVNGEHDQILFQRRRDVPEAPDTDDSDDDDAEQSDPGAETVQVTHDLAASTLSGAPTSLFGSGLKRPLNSEGDAIPAIRKRRRRNMVKDKPSMLEDNTSDAASLPEEKDEAGSDEEWAGFSSDNSAESEDEAGSESERSQSEEADSDDEEDSEEDSASETDTAAENADSSTRVSAFKAWADSQRNAAVGFTPSVNITQNDAVKQNFKPRAPSPDALVESILNANATSTARPAAAITIPRSDDVQKVRLELPVVQEEQKIMEAINAHPVVVICGATGSGKTTQVPQMLFENGYGSHIGRGNISSEMGLQSGGKIGVTQPRRVAATSVADRVAFELGDEYRGRVGHQVRYDTNVSRDTAIKFMTDGILLREISQDFILSTYSAIVIDEAHERSVNTDILIGMLSRIVSLRADLAKEDPNQHYPLKLVIMSATLRVADFAQNSRLFRNELPPIVQAEGRQFTVTEHFSRKTRHDYVDEMVNKVARGHKKLPPGTMLVFLTAQNEIQTVAKRLKEQLGGNTVPSTVSKHSDPRHMPAEVDDYENNNMPRINDYLEGEESDAESDASITGLDPDVDDDEFLVEDVESVSGARPILRPHILPLYAALPTAQQMKVFQPPPDGSRLIVLATNVAETSLTIPGVRYVFDCGRSKEKRYDPASGVQTFEVDWISKASASQRAGRAGRTGPGHVYRLFSSAVYEQFFAEHSVPEILRTPLESTMLQLKSMEIENVVNFPFPTSPNPVDLARAERLLRSLGAIDDKTARITDIGREIMAYPVNPRFGKMLLLAQQNHITASVIAIVAALAVGELFIPEVKANTAGKAQLNDSSSEDSDDAAYQARQVDLQEQSAAHERHRAYSRSQATLSRWDDQSDAIKLLTAVAAHAEASSKSRDAAGISKFCSEYFLREKGMQEIQQLRHQLQNIANARRVGQLVPFHAVLPLPSETERKMLKQIIAVGYLNQVAIRSDLLKDQAIGFGRKPRRAGEVAYRTLVPSAEVDKTLPLHEQEMQRSVFVHPSSVLAHLSTTEMPSYIVYSHLSRAPAATITDGAKPSRTRMHPLTTIGPKQLAALAEGTPLLELGKPIGKIEDMEGGQRQCWLSVALKSPVVGGSRWPLGAWKVIQKRRAGIWELERVISR